MICGVVPEKQIEANAAARQAEYEEFLAQKVEVDRVVAEMHAQEAQKEQARLEKQKETKAFIAGYLAERAQWKEKEKQKQAAEMAVIEAWNKKMEERLSAIKAAKAEKAAGQDELFARVSAEIQANRKAREETEQLLMDLVYEENLAADREKERQKERKKEAMRVEMTEANEKAKQYKAIQMEKERQEEEVYRQQLMDKFAADEKLEQLSKQKQHEKRMTYKKQVDALLADRRALYAKEQEMNLKMKEDMEQHERFRKTIIERERQRLLLEHADKLRSFLPRSVLKTKEEVELVFGKDYVQQFGDGL